MGKVLAYRIEHKETKLGPFQHSKQEVINKGVDGSIKAYRDLDYEPEVKKLLKKYKGLVKFGFTKWSQCKKAIKDKKILADHGFVVNVYKVLPEYISDDFQVLYIDNQFLYTKL